jgi:hypothetical protein
LLRWEPIERFKLGFIGRKTGWIWHKRGFIEPVKY